MVESSPPSSFSTDAGVPSSYIASLTQSFAAIPPAAAPGVVDCVLASSVLSSPLLFNSLIDSFPNPVDGLQHNHILSFTAALCHLAKQAQNPGGALRSLIWRVFVPIFKSINASDSLLLFEAEVLLCDVVSVTSSWDVATVTLVTLCLRSVGCALDMLQSVDLAIYQWSCDGILDEHFGDLSLGTLPLAVACAVLSSLLEAALRRDKEMQPSEQALASGYSSETLEHNMMWDISDMALRMLGQSPDLRSYAIRLFLPHIFRTFNMLSCVKVSVHGSQHILTRSQFLRKIWNHCLSLFSLGHLERLDAYHVLSLYLSFHQDPNGYLYLSSDYPSEEFDLGEETEFWEEIQKGLVDRNQSLRKQALYILKACLSRYYSAIRRQEADPLSGASLKFNLNMNTSQGITQDGKPTHTSMTKREKWAAKEAKSIGVGEVCHFGDHCLSSQDRWKVFLLLYEMLEEYGTHLVEAAWTHQVSLLVHRELDNDCANSYSGDVHQDQVGSLDGTFRWLAVLWERGLFHDNPQVRCLIMQSFLDFAWEERKTYAQKVPRNFLLGPLILGLNDAVHHKDFGIKGVYTSKTIEGARRYFYELFFQLSFSERVRLLHDLAYVGRKESFGRAGLMALATCIGSAACVLDIIGQTEDHYANNRLSETNAPPDQELYLAISLADFLDALGFLIERSKQHYNPQYRMQVCEQILMAACSVINICDVPLDALLHFIGTIPREFTDIAGPLRRRMQLWFSDVKASANLIDTRTHVLRGLGTFQMRFIQNSHSQSNFFCFDDEDVDAWGVEAQKWARATFLVVSRMQHLKEIFKCFESYVNDLSKECSENLACIPVKLHILILGLIEEFKSGWMKYSCCTEREGKPLELNFLQSQAAPFSFEFSQSFVRRLLSISENLLSFAKLASPLLWSLSKVVNADLPSSIKGKLGGPSQRRLAPATTSAVLQAVISVRVVSTFSSLCTEFGMDDAYDASYLFLCDFIQKVLQYPMYETEAGAELHLAAYETLASVFKALSTFSTGLLNGFIVDYNKSSNYVEETEFLLDPLLLSFLKNINIFLDGGLLTRSRRAVLLDSKWLCLDSLLVIPYNVMVKDIHNLSGFSFSDAALRTIFVDILESLESAGESSVLAMLRSVRSVLGLLYSDRMRPKLVSGARVDKQFMVQLVQSSWVLHLSCNKRRVAPIAALLSAVLHQSIFSDMSMHETDGGEQGPLKWFVLKLIEEGEKSPRTIRLAALHLSGLWLRYPKTIRYYIKELKLLCLYGSVAFDEDFEAELFENSEARIEIPSLAQSPDTELTEVFINTEMYARVSVGVLFHRLSEVTNTRGDQEDEYSVASLHCGKMFLIELLDSAVNDKDLAKELYKKYSAVHRRKIRVWQMICILSNFVDEEIVKKVTSKLHICLYRNNIPAVRQYLEIFAILIYLKFPKLAEEELLPIFGDYNMRPQAVSSYVFIAANLIVHAKDSIVQAHHLNELLPPIIPLLTSHHHSLRGFTQLLVHYVLSKLWPSKSIFSETGTLERKCLSNLKIYLAENVDCIRLRASMEGFLDAFDPIACATPAGIFNSRNEGSNFECVPVSLLEQVIDFLNDVREELRSSIAKDEDAIKKEMLSVGDSFKGMHINNDETSQQAPKDVFLDFQKKISLYAHDREHVCGDTKSGPDKIEIPRLLLDMEGEDLLLASTVQSRCQALEMLRQAQQEFILVASLIDRIPNLAGLARTCEVFKAAGLVVNDAGIVQDRQFQLISVTAEKWVPIIEVPVSSMKFFLEKKRKEGFSILGLEQTANSTPLDQFSFPTKTVLVLGREKEGIPVDIIHVLDACVEIPQLGIIRSLNVHVSGAIALWEYTRQHRLKKV